MRIPINNIITFILRQCKDYKIDESHSLSHALNVLDYSTKIYNAELTNFPQIQKQKNVIFTSALLHDMCDAKYVEQLNSLDNIKTFLNENEYNNEEVDAICNIVNTMSYSKVLKYGYPNLKEYQYAYHIVRESDLLCGLQFNRAVLFSIYKDNMLYNDAFAHAKKIYDRRTQNIIDQQMFVTAFGKELADQIYKQEFENIKNLESFIL